MKVSEEFVRSDDRSWKLSNGTRMLKDGGSERLQSQTAILVVEDDGPIAKRLAEGLEEAGYKVSRASSGAEARLCGERTRSQP